jgi:hypothetical protein
MHMNCQFSREDRNRRQVWDINNSSSQLTAYLTWSQKYRESTSHLLLLRLTCPVLWYKDSGTFDVALSESYYNRYQLSYSPFWNHEDETWYLKPLQTHREENSRGSVCPSLFWALPLSLEKLPAKIDVFEPATCSIVRPAVLLISG